MSGVALRTHTHPTNTRSKDGFPYPFICSGDVNCYFDARVVPARGSDEATSLWPFRWGSQQFGITPGHTMVQLVWNKGSAGEKRGARGEVV